MKLRQFTKSSFASLALLGLSMGTAQGAIMSWVAGADGAWETGANWQTNDTIPVNRVPTTGDDVRPGTGGHLVTYSSASGTSTIGRFTQFGANPNVVSQTGGTLNNTTASGGGGLMYLASNAGTSSLPNYSISGGTLAVQRSLNMSWNNAHNVTSTMLQTSGTVSFGDDINMALARDGQSATYDLQGGTLTARGINMGNGGNTYTTLFDQTGGAATLANQLALGKSTTKTGSSIYNLHGGSLTIENSTTPFFFTTDGASTAYLDFLGSGTLNLEGSWDFASLTGISDSDFRVAGVTATAGDLAFNPVTIDTMAYTQITVIPEPSSALLLGLAGLALAVRRRG